jgi:hypothetical protein
VSRTTRVAIAMLGLAALARLIWLCFDTFPEFDEYATMWFSDPSIGVGTLYRERWVSETNPPLYYLLIWLARRVTDTTIEPLRLAHVPVFVVVVAYLLGCMGWHRARRFYLGSMAVLYVSSGVCFQFFPDIRSYFLQFSLAVTACAALVILRDPREGGEMLHRVVFAVALVLLMNLHFTGALFGGIWVACVLLAEVLRRRWDLAAFLLATSVVAALPALLFVALNFTALSGQVGHFWITTTTPEALGRMAIVVRGSAGRNIALLLAVALALVAVLRRRWGGGALDPEGMLSTAVTDGIAVLVFLVVIGAANWYHPIIIVRYLMVASAPLMSMLSVAAEEALMRYRCLMPAVIANGALAVLLMALYPAEARPQAWADRWIVARLARSCPTTRVYGLWQDQTRSDLYRTMYAMNGRLFGFAVQPQMTGAPWTPLLDPACPTILWAEHAKGRNDVQGVADFIASFNLELDPSVVQQARLRITPSVGLLLLLPPSG